MFDGWILNIQHDLIAIQNNRLRTVSVKILHPWFNFDVPLGSTVIKPVLAINELWIHLKEIGEEEREGSDIHFETPLFCFPPNALTGKVELTVLAWLSRAMLTVQCIHTSAQPQVLYRQIARFSQCAISHTHHCEQSPSTHGCRSHNSAKPALIHCEIRGTVMVLDALLYE